VADPLDRPELSLGDAEFRMFRDFFREACGLFFDEDSRFLLERRLARRIRELGLGSFSAYHYLIRRDTAGDEELAAAIDDLTTNETYFFREHAQLRALVSEILPELLERRRAAGGSVVSVWSAGCSSGEEPYSIVIMAREAGLVPGRDLRVYASDISRRMLQRARRGVYRPASFRETDPLLKKRYFAESEGVWRIDDEVKRHVVFTHQNLLDRCRMALLGPMDVILCRNVIIYFDLETKRRVIEAFDEKIRPGGYLLLGHSESLINVSNAFQLRHLTHDIVYRKPAPGDEPGERWERAARRAIAATRPPGEIE
jgi:chemotaxis protein methyltransferase CheR